MLASCEEETIRSSEGTTPALTKMVPSTDFYRAHPKEYRQAGVDFRREYFGRMSDNLSFDPNFPVANDDAYSLEYGFSKIEMLSHLVQLSPDDVQETKNLLVFFDQLAITPATKISAGRAMVDEYMTSKNITVERTPLTYHIVELTKESLFTLGFSADGPDFSKDGENDGKFCVFKPKKCTGWEGFILNGGTAAITIANIIVVAASGGTLTPVKLITSEIFKTIFKAFANRYCAGSSNAYECDDCDAPYDFGYFRQGCTTYGIRPLGRFQWAESIELMIDGNSDGDFITVTDQLPVNVEFPQIRFTSTEIFDLDPSTQNGYFDIKANMICDGGTLAEWSQNSPDRVILSIPPDFPVPSATIRITNNPPTHPSVPMQGFYAYGTELKFSIASVTMPGMYTFTGWSTTSGGSPGTGGAQSTFTTTFFGSSGTTASVNANFRNNCNGQTHSIAYSLVILP